MIEPTLFLGPPGTGKTTTLLNTVLQEMEGGVPPDRIGFMTFTRRGVEEAITRAEKRFKLPRKDFRFFNTLHSAAFRHLGLSSAQVFAGDKITQFASTHGLTIYSSSFTDDGTYSDRTTNDDLTLFLDNYSRITRKPLYQVLLSNAPYIGDVDHAMSVTKALHAYKQEEGLFDFTDMLEEFIRLDEPPRLDVLMIDEAQDLSELQWAMVEILARHVKRLYIAGDDDQTIFTWAGASERFITMPGKEVVLSQSYRIPSKIHVLANKIISRVSRRREKPWQPRNAEGSITSINAISRLNPELFDPEVCNSAMMLGRTVKMVRKTFIPYCRFNGIPYMYFDARCYKPTHAMAVDAWVRLADGMMVSASDVCRIYDLLPGENYRADNQPAIKRGFKKNMKMLADQPEEPRFTLRELYQDYGLIVEGTWQDVFTEIPPTDKEFMGKIIKNRYSLLENPRVHISTIHRVKGGQADKVILLADTSKVGERLNYGSMDEETRVFYTGVTRTYEDLVVVNPTRQYGFEGLFI